MARLEPPISDVAVPFWDATRDERLLLQWCKACEQAIHYPREVCPTCLGDDLEWRESSGQGEIYAFNVMHRPGNRGMADRVPYVIALVALDEGVRMVTNIVGREPASLAVGTRVKVTWESLSDGRNLPLFEPTGS
jgi:uncharacterized OB-fold protein